MLGEMAERGDAINTVVLMTRLKERGSSVELATIAALTDKVPLRSDLI
jgi:hypothetical protein